MLRFSDSVLMSSENLFEPVSSHPPMLWMRNGTDRECYEACLMFYRTAVQRQGKGKNNETSEGQPPALCIYS